MNLRSVKWERNVAAAGICGGVAILSRPDKWPLGLLVAVGFFLFGCLVDMGIEKYLQSRKPRKIAKVKCNACLHEAAAMCFYFVWYPGCEGPEPRDNPCLRCPKCGSQDIEEVNA